MKGGVMPPPESLIRSCLVDPRLYQIASLATLLTYGLLWREFDVSAGHILVTLTMVLVAQYTATRLAQLPVCDPKSALISGLSLCLLLRTEYLAVAALAAALAIGSKFVLRGRDKHLCNPTTLALGAVLITDLGWLSPGQWGHAAWFGFLVLSLGSLVVTRAARADVTLTFLGVYFTALFSRAWWLEDPIAIPLHQLESGALLVFAFFMLSDPKTTPDSRTGRIIFGALVALTALLLQFQWFPTNAPLWALLICAPTVPLLDWAVPGYRYTWGRPDAPDKAQTVYAPLHSLGSLTRLHKETVMTRILMALLLLGTMILLGHAPAAAFCGFFVAQADTQLNNSASEVVIVRHENKTVLTMANDVSGDVKDFAMVVPVPTVLAKDQLHIGEPALLAHLAAYSAPRLVEYFDDNPCYVQPHANRADALALPASPGSGQPRSKGVTVEAQYTVGEYDIVILSAKESAGLESWLTDNGYRLPPGAAPILHSYLKQGFKFFVAKVNLGEHARLGLTRLRPLQMAFETPKFMLPIRLGTVNANGPQELILYMLTKNGRVETTNYRTVRLPESQELPLYIKDRFNDFYRAMFLQQTKAEQDGAVFLEYAWDMNWCDPCAATPLAAEELRKLGVFWQEPAQKQRRAMGGTNVFLTRLHVRYDAGHFPEDLVFQETSDRAHYQARFVLRHPWTGTETCRAADAYREGLPARYETQARTLAHLAGWSLTDIRQAMQLPTPGPDAESAKWYQRLWGN
jgi:hypothetical protein